MYLEYFDSQYLMNPKYYDRQYHMCLKYFDRQILAVGASPRHIESFDLVTVVILYTLSYSRGTDPEDGEEAGGGDGVRRFSRIP